MDNNELGYAEYIEQLARKAMSGDMASLGNDDLINLLLSFTSRQKDTRAATLKLFESFGSISEILNAPLSGLESIEGINRNSAELLKTIPEIRRKCFTEQISRKKLQGICEIEDFVENYYIGAMREKFMLICLNEKQRMLSYHIISEGNVHSSSVDINKMVTILHASRAKYAIIAHNHPRESAVPSRADINATKNICVTFEKIGVKLLNHIVVGINEHMLIVPEDI